MKPIRTFQSILNLKGTAAFKIIRLKKWVIVPNLLILRQFYPQIHNKAYISEVLHLHERPAKRHTTAEIEKEEKKAPGKIQTRSS